MRIDTNNIFSLNFQKKYGHNGLNNVYLNNCSEKYYTNPIYNNVSGDTVSFSGGVNFQKINMGSSTDRLLKQINKILNLMPRQISDDELQEIMLARYNAFERKITNRLAELEQRVLAWIANKTLNPQQCLNQRNEMLKEVNLLRKMRPAPINFAEPGSENALDFELINKFKLAILDGNFNLLRVMRDHYSGLNSVKTIEELKEMYPAISVPVRPEDVIGKKMAGSITREFYEDLDDLVLAEKDELADRKLEDKFIEIAKTLPLEKYNIKPSEFASRVYEKFVHAVAENSVKGRKTGSFTFIPIIIKQKGNLISENDFRLFSIDYDSFVINTLKEQYLNSAKLKDLNIQGINPFLLKEREYKFEKIPNTIQKLISEGMTLRETQKSYSHFGPEQFKERLTFYTDRYGENEELLAKMVDFVTCRFEGEDIDSCTQLLQELDKVWDGEKPLQEALNAIKHKNLYPVGTAKINTAEYWARMNKIKSEQKLVARLRNEQEKFDEVINLLYKNNMNYAAGLCSKYRPENFSDEGLRNSEYILKMIMREVNNDGVVVNKAGLDSAIARWDTYFEYKHNGVNNEILVKAEQYAKGANGEINAIEAGRYIINYETVNLYPKSLEYYKDKEVLTKVMELSGKNKDKACEYLCKFSHYNDMLPAEKSKISEIMKIYDIKDNVDKTIVKYICDNYYYLTDTTAKSVINESGQTVDATIGSKAKQEVADYYKFPLCLDYLLAFEDALSIHAGAVAEAGIKRFKLGNALTMELKIKGFPDRLLSSKNNYYFDEFSPKGLHKKIL